MLHWLLVSSTFWFWPLPPTPSWTSVFHSTIHNGPLRFESPQGFYRHALKHAEEVCGEDPLPAGQINCYSERLERLRVDLAYWFVGRRNPGFRVTRMAVQRRKGFGPSYILDVCYDDFEHLRLVLRPRKQDRRLIVVTFYRLFGPC